MQDEASLSAAVARTGFLTAPRPKLCARQSQRGGNDPAAGGEEDCNHTRAVFLGRPHIQVREGRDLSEEMLSLLTNAMYSRIYSLTSTAIVSEYSVCGVPMSSKTQKYFKLYRGVSYYHLVPSPPETWFRGMSVGGSFRRVSGRAHP